MLNTSWPIPIIMPTKRLRKQLKSAIATFLEYFKKKRTETSPLLNLVQFRINDNKLSTTNTINTEDESASANETNLDIKEKKNDNIDEVDLKGVKSRTKVQLILKFRKLR